MLKSYITDKSVYKNKVIMKDSQGREYSSDILDIVVYDENGVEHKVQDLLTYSYEMNKTYNDTVEELNNVRTEFDELLNKYNLLKASMQEYVDTNKKINELQSETIDALDKKINILVERLKTLESKTALL